MSILGIGVDVLHLPRIFNLIKRYPSRLHSRILSAQELLDLPGNHESRLRFIAVRWAVKEAAYKAFYPHLRPSWKDLTLRKDGPKPKLELKEWAGRIHVSVSHDGEYVFASVLVENE
ncbi:4'-phosphopantetheinyl transferase [Mycena indigotica]|uniref:4'-phosphopantetheinyl transferase n=1 Tax=Mycena indigotica TaxID=2126181 RepID=A0A8H6SKK7_9AGAR|nr:4'-phosphopantetheinyl transferase [Mycena indigotica]KAF7301333.1 4'-phosphopantetheinyl transferase [Mycena indigotica]